MLLQLTNLLENVRVHNVDLDLWIWLDSHSGAYSRNSAYVHQFQEVESEPLCNTLAETWRFKIPSKVAFLIWRVIRDRLLRKENLLKRGIMGLQNPFPLSHIPSNKTTGIHSPTHS